MPTNLYHAYSTKMLLKYPSDDLLSINRSKFCLGRIYVVEVCWPVQKNGGHSNHLT